MTSTDQKTVAYRSVSERAADDIIAVATQKASEAGWAVSVAVADRGGWLVSFKRMEGGVTCGVGGAIEKARSATKFQDSLIEFSRMAKEQDWIGNMPGLIPLGGAEPLWWEGELVGAVAVSGANEAVEQAFAAAAAASFNQ